MPKSPVRILFVDDTKEEFILIRELLNDVEGMEFEFQWASDMATAMQAIQSSRFDVCFVDYYLGKDNGLAFTREAIAQGILTPFILMSGQKNQQINREALKIGIRECVDKNELTTSTLMLVINQVTGSVS